MQASYLTTVIWLFGFAAVFLASLSVRLLGAESLQVRNEAAIADVLAGRRLEADAAWWGFDPQDATHALQSAIDSGAKVVVVPDMGSDWIVRPIRLVGHQEIRLAEGVVLSAKRGEYRGRSDSLFTARDIDHLTIRGYGATLRMNKRDYLVGSTLNPEDRGSKQKWLGHYEKSEGRHAFSLRGCSHVNLHGLTISDSGGDGIYIAGAGKRPFCEHIQLKDVTCNNHYRQGISIISAVDLLVENCRFSDTWGTPPSAGVDIEPNESADRLQDIVFRKCQFQDNFGDGIQIYLIGQRDPTTEVSILFDQCRVSSRWGTGVRVGKLSSDGPRGQITFRDCEIRDTAGYGLRIDDKSQQAARLRFERCQLYNVAQIAASQDPWTPIWFHPQRAGKPPVPGNPEAVQYLRFGGIDIVDCSLKDRFEREAISTIPAFRQVKLHDIHGNLRVENPYGARAYFADQQIDLVIDAGGKRPNP